MDIHLEVNSLMAKSYYLTLMDSERLKKLLLSLLVGGEIFFFKSKITHITPILSDAIESLDKFLCDGLWEEGRMFNRDVEVRWQLEEGGDLKVLILSEKGIDEQLLPQEGVEVKDNWETEETRIILWGQPKDEFWVEVKIPKRLIYPISQKGEVVIQGFNCSENQRVTFTRFKEIKTDGK